MCKITTTAAVAYIIKARHAMKVHPQWRFGQALFNVLPGDICDHIRETELDFYYDRDESVVLAKFYTNCVEV